jgi:SPP1 gp7 family putative phage head morphogenesis protein
MPGAFASQVELAGKAWRRKYPRKTRLPRGYAPRLPIGIEREYALNLSLVLKTIRENVERVMIPALPGLVGQRKEFRPDHFDAADDVHRLWRQISILTEEQIDEPWATETAKRRGLDVATFNRKTIERQVFRVIGLNPIFSDSYLPAEMSLFTVQNVNLITSFRDETLRKLETSMLVDFQNGTRAEDIAKNLLSQVDPSVSNARARANLIARDQISKLNGQLTQLRQQDLGIERYTWRTMGDGRVRDSHAALNGQVFRWDDPPEPGHPGDDYQCRCYAEPYLADVVPGLDG